MAPPRPVPVPAVVTRLSAVLLFCALFAPAVLAAPYERQIELAREFVEQEMAAQLIPGMSIGFIKDDFQWAEGFGYSDLENRVPAKPESAYRLASVTKPMTAIAVLQLVAQGKIDLDAEVTTYVPYFPKKQWPVTVRGLLGHLGGISHYRDYDAEGHFKDHKDTREAIAVFEDFELVAEPGTRFNYSSYGYNLLGAVIEGASGMAYGEFLEQHLWAPLGMDATVMDDPDALISNRVRGYRLGPGGDVVNSEFVDVSSRFAAGGTRSTVLDMLKFARGVMAGKVLPPELMDAMHRSMATRDGRNTGYGMGWNVRPINGRFSYGHSGGQAETRTYLICFPGARFAVAVACNFEEADRGPFYQRLYQLIIGEPFLPPVLTGDPAGDQIHRALTRTFNHGLAHWDRYGKAAAEERAELDAAFDYFGTWVDEETLASSFDQARDKISTGSHPASDSAFVRAGSYMAARIAQHQGEERLEALHGEGPVAFFGAYLDAYKQKRRNVPKRYRLDKRLARRIEAWQADWAKTWDAEMRQFHLGPAADPEQAASRLRAKLAGAAIRPDYMEQFGSLTQSLYLRGDYPAAARAANAALSVYPRSGQANVLAGLAALGQGDRAQADVLLATGKELDAGGAGALNGWAYGLHSSGQTALGLELLEIACGLYPQVANLYDSTGELLLATGDTEKAIASYQKALEVDPDLDSAKRMLEQIRSRKE